MKINQLTCQHASSNIVCYEILYFRFWDDKSVSKNGEGFPYAIFYWKSFCSLETGELFSEEKCGEVRGEKSPDQ